MPLTCQPVPAKHNVVLEHEDGYAVVMFDTDTGWYICLDNPQTFIFRDSPQEALSDCSCPRWIFSTKDEAMAFSQEAISFNHVVYNFHRLVMPQ